MDIVMEDVNFKAKERVTVVSISTDPDELAFYAQDSSRLVRNKVAKNSHTPSTVLESMWEAEKTSSIAENLAGNRSTPGWLLSQFCFDVRKRIWHNAYRNLSTELDAVIQSALKFQEYERAHAVTQSLSKRRNSEEKAYRYLAEAGWVDPHSTYEDFPEGFLIPYFHKWLVSN